MKIESAVALLAVALLADAGPVTDGPSNENTREAESVLKAYGDSLAGHLDTKQLTIDVCDVETKLLSACFEKAEEADGAGCWEECVIPASDNPDSCDGFCLDVEACRRDKCSSGPACGSQYYDVLNCILGTVESAEQCTCTGSWILEHLTREETLAAGDASEDFATVTGEESVAVEEGVEQFRCQAEAEVLSVCFDDNKEEDGASCWEDSIIPAHVTFTDPAHDSFESCDSFCSAVEQRRSNKCSSGSACVSQFYDTLSCAVPRCTCTGHETMKEEVTLAAEEGVESMECQAESQVLSDCFDFSGEVDGAGCWEDCVIPALQNQESCDEFCSAVEQCRSKKCSSGPACASQYYDTLSCAVKRCTCTGHEIMKEEVTLAVEEGIESIECQAETQVLSDCFASNEVLDGADCWDKCTIPAHDNFESCDSFCSAVKQCRDETCSSGPACESQYYDTLNCAVPRCTCTGHETMKEEETLAVEEGIESIECQAESQVLSDCFDFSGEEDGAGCWEDCVLPAMDNQESCDEFCSAVEQCRSKKCSSGPACESQYYDTLSCAVKKCTCTGHETMKEDETSSGTCASDTCTEI